MVLLADLQDARWRKQRIHELAKRWGIPPEQVVDSLLLESYLQEIRSGKNSETVADTHQELPLER